MRRKLRKVPLRRIVNVEKVRGDGVPSTRAESVCLPCVEMVSDLAATTVVPEYIKNFRASISHSQLYPCTGASCAAIKDSIELMN